MSLHDQQHRLRLDGILQSQDPTAALRESDLADCSTCREEVAVAQELAALLDEVAADEQESLRGAAAMAEEGRDERVVAGLRDHLQQNNGPQQLLRRPALRPQIAIAAAAAILLGFWIWGPAEHFEEPLGAGRGAPLLGTSDAGLWPAGEVQQVEEFRWQQALPRGGWFRVQVYRPGSGDAGLLWSSDELYESVCVLPEQVQLPTEFRWELEIYDGSQGSFAAQVLRADVKLVDE